ncbi:MAG: stage III sporulation protein AD [Clostridia bacterium]|nr:stage III sporulation protein AD [Clostridia bacterium]
MIVLIKIVGLALVIVTSFIVVKHYKPELAIMVEVAGAILLLSYIIDLLEESFNLFDYILDSTGIDSDLFVVLLKIIGVAYLTEFGANLCQDCGSSSVASKVLLAGKLMIFVLAIPIIKALINLLVSVMQ